MSAFCRTFRGALGRTRTCDLLNRSQTRSRTGGDREGHGETKPCFYRQLSTSKGTGTDRERHGVVVPLWYEMSARQDSNLRPSLFVVRFFERDAVGYGAKFCFLEEFSAIRRDAAVSGSRQRTRQRCEMASKE